MDIATIASLVGIGGGMMAFGLPIGIPIAIIVIIIVIVIGVWWWKFK